MRPKEEAKAACLAAIEQQLATVGSKGWAALMQQHPLISRTGFFRLVAAAKAGKPPQEILTQAVRQARRLARESLPAMPSPNYIAHAGEAARHNLTFMGNWAECMADARDVRDWSSAATEDGRRRISNPGIFIQSIKLRVELLETQIKAFREVYDMRRIQEFFDAMMAEIQEESPATAERIMARLAKLNDEMGFTVDARAG